jgi:hypothetical protein
MNLEFNNKKAVSNNEEVGVLLIEQFKSVLESASDDWALIELVMARHPLDVEFRFKLISKDDLVRGGVPKPDAVVPKGMQEVNDFD